MTKQEEIREGIARALGRWKGAWGDGFQHNYWLAQADLALDYLHSQGVVIKVDREFYKGQALVFLKDVEEAGYVAVKPLIEEK